MQLCCCLSLSLSLPQRTERAAFDEDSAAQDLGKPILFYLIGLDWIGLEFRVHFYYPPRRHLIKTNLKH